MFQQGRHSNTHSPLTGDFPAQRASNTPIVLFDDAITFSGRVAG